MGLRFRKLCLIVLIFFGPAATLWAGQQSADQSDASARETTSQNSAPPRVCHLYFADAEYRYLAAERLLIPSGLTSEAAALAIVKGLVKGPREGHQRTVPVDTEINALYVAGDGTAYLDLSEGIMHSHPGGGFSELLTLLSIVNSLTLNLEAVQQVKFLINGGEAPTLAGHLDLKQPYKADLLLIR